MLFKALQPGVPPLLRREGKTPLAGYVKKGDHFEWIVGPPYPYWAEPVDDEAKAAVAAAKAAKSGAAAPLNAPSISVAEAPILSLPVAAAVSGPVPAVPKPHKKLGRPKGSRNRPRVHAPATVPSEG